MISSRSVIILFWRFLLIDKNKNNNIKTKTTIKPTHLWYVKPSLFNFPEHKPKKMCNIYMEVKRGGRSLTLHCIILGQYPEVFARFKDASLSG